MAEDRQQRRLATILAADVCHQVPMSAFGASSAIGTLPDLPRLICMPEHENADRARAERMFKAREYQKADAAKATADYYAAEQRIRDRTQQLRRLRFEREALKKVLSD